ncbi:MAG: DUF1207 domain-containing protein [Gemmatimonadales bacterium]
MRYNAPRIAVVAGLGLAGVLVPARAGAQSWVLPRDVPPFELPLASPRTSALVGRIIHLSRGESRFGAEWEAEPALGEILPLFALSRGRVPVVIHLGAEVYGRFSLADGTSAHISNDWHVNLIGTARVRSWQFAFEAYHESSHLGDEYRDRFEVPRLDWSRGILGVWLGYTIGGLDLRGNASYAALDALDLERSALALAADYRGRPGWLLGAATQAIAALHADAQAYTDWRPTYSGRAGVRFSEARASRGLAVLLTFLSGQSTQRQFYSRRSRYVGVEVRFDL